MFEDLDTKVNQVKKLSTMTETGQENRIFNSSPGEKSLNLEKETREQSRIQDEMLGLKTSQSRQRYREENWDIKGYSFLSEGKLIILYNDGEKNPNLLEQRQKPYVVVSQKIDSPDDRAVLANKLAMQACWRDSPQVRKEITYLVNLVQTPFDKRDQWSQIVMLIYCSLKVAFVGLQLQLFNKLIVLITFLGRDKVIRSQLAIQNQLSILPISGQVGILIWLYDQQNTL